MLSAAHRMTHGSAFGTTTRRGRRARAGTLVVHLDVPTQADQDDSPEVGFVVGRAVGAAVQRNRVRRRLRHLMRPVVDGLPAGSRLVVRALPGAAGESSARLGRDLERALGRVRDAADQHEGDRAAGDRS